MVGHSRGFHVGEGLLPHLNLFFFVGCEGGSRWGNSWKCKFVQYSVFKTLHWESQGVILHCSIHVLVEMFLASRIDLNIFSAFVDTGWDVCLHYYLQLCAMI